jgi:excisionase family DNA binding protein
MRDTQAVGAGGDRGEGKARPLWTRGETAEFLSVSLRHLWAITDRGDLPCIKLGRTVRYAIEDIEAYLKRSRTGGEGA